jgi:hypothetical protein
MCNVSALHIGNYSQASKAKSREICTSVCDLMGDSQAFRIKAYTAVRDLKYILKLDYISFLHC